jgi:thiamine pyrophosphokinase
LQRILIFANGELPDLDKARSLAQTDDYIICADGGTRHALALGLQPDLIVGDMDSAEPAQLQELRKANVTIESFSHDKDQTDLELAINRALALKPKKIVIVGGLGGRLDQTLANITLLTMIDSRNSISASTMGWSRSCFAGTRSRSMEGAGILSP